MKQFLAAAHLLPYDPEAKKRTSSNKHPAAQISAISVEDANIAMATGATKASNGKTGVHLHYHTSREYRELTMEQKELLEWHPSIPDKENKHNKMNKEKYPTKKQLSSVVAKEVQKMLAAGVNAQSCSGHDSKSNDNDIDPEKYKTSVVNATAAKMQAEASEEKPKDKVILKSILKHVKNSQA